MLARDLQIDDPAEAFTSYRTALDKYSWRDHAGVPTELAFVMMAAENKAVALAEEAATELQAQALRACVAEATAARARQVLASRERLQH